MIRYRSSRSAPGPYLEEDQEIGVVCVSKTSPNAKLEPRQNRFLERQVRSLVYPKDVCYRS